MTSRSPLRRVATIALLAGAGALLGYQVGHWLKAGERLSGLNAADGGALTLGAALLAQALIVLAISFAPSKLSRLAGTESWPESAAQRGFWRQQAVVLALAGGMLAAPPLAVILSGGPLPRLLAMSVMAGVIAAFALQTALNLVVWQRSDEFVRRLVAETATVCFWLLQGALFLWAVGERLGLVSGLDAWSGAVILMGVYLIASATISLRNGMAA